MKTKKGKMKIELKKFIDFKAVFEYLITEQRSELELYRYEADHYKDILNFVDHQKIEFSINIEECEFDNRFIGFVFDYDFQDSNESNTQSTTASYYIMFDLVLDEFVSCEYVQG